MNKYIKTKARLQKDYIVFRAHPFVPQSKYISYLVTYLLTPWRRILLEKLTGLQPVKKFPAFHGTRRFITALTSVRQIYLYNSKMGSHFPTCCEDDSTLNFGRQF